MKQKIYIDFDGTLFDTDRFYRDFLSICSKYGLEQEKIDLAKQELFSKENLFNMDIILNYLVNTYNISKNIILDVKAMFSSNYVYDDVVSSLETLKEKYELIILTYGNIEYQEQKIYGSKLSIYFNDVIISEKNKSLLDNVDYSGSIFIDNNPKEIKRFVDVNSKEVIRIRRESDKYSIKNLEVEVSEYTCFLDIVKHLVGKSKNYF